MQTVPSFANRLQMLVFTRFLAFSVMVIAPFGPVLSQPVATRLRAYLTQLPDSVRVSLAVESLHTDSLRFYHRADVRTPSASIIKLPILVEAMERVKAGQLDLDEIHILVDSEKTGGAGVLATYSNRSRISYRDLLTLMITQSDNTATNILIDEFGMANINARMDSIGLKTTRLNRVMMDTLAVRQGRENYITAREMNGLLTKIYRHEVATPALCEQMITILKQNADTATIPSLLPTGMMVAHKTGTLSYVRGDAGIVYGRQPFVLTIVVQGTTTPEAERIIGELAKLCVD